MPQSIKRSCLILFLAFAGSILGACAASRADNVILAMAEQERAAASMRLAKAMSRYCALTTDTLLARDACLLEQYLSVLALEPLEHSLASTLRYGRAQSLR